MPSMKLCVISLLVVTIFAGCFDRGKKTKEISTVFSKCLEAETNSAPDGKPIYYRGRATNANFTTYVAYLHRIDTQTCPSKFRNAWEDYVETAEGCIPDTGVYLSPGETHDEALYYARLFHSTILEKLSNCVAIAAQYGVTNIRPSVVLNPELSKK